MILYSNNCPKCKMLKQKLDVLNINYEVFDDIDKMIEMRFMSMPVLEVDNKRLGFVDAIKWIDERVDD